MNERVLNIVKCLVCGHYGTGKEFTVPTGGGDYDGQCPVCFTQEPNFQNIETEAECIAELNALRRKGWKK